MPTTLHVESESDESSFDGEYDAPAINDVESLRKGIIKTSKHNAQAPYTILLVGETGTGKSTFLEFLDNVLNGKDVNRYEFKTLDHKNEQDDSGGQSQTNSARTYELSSKNGISVRILDVPGLADTRGIRQDALHKESITTEIHNNLDAINAVLILANGSVPRMSVTVDYALTTLSALFPKSLANNIGFLFSNTPDERYLNFPDDAIPEVLNHAPKFLIDNPIALQKNYLKQRDRMNERTAKKRNELMKGAEQDALEMLVKLFDWLDGLEPQPTTEIIALYEKSQVIESMITDRAVIKNRMEMKFANVNAVPDLEKLINLPGWRPERAPTFHYLCGEPHCYSTCYVDDNTVSALLLVQFRPLPCDVCHHSHSSHFHAFAKWVKRDDDDMKKNWEAVKDEKEKAEALIAASGLTVDDLIDEGTDGLGQLVEEYAGLSLSGSFSGPLEKAIRLLELHCKNMEEQGVSGDQLVQMRGSVETMGTRLDLLRKSNKRVVSKARGAVERARKADGGAT